MNDFTLGQIEMEWVIIIITITTITLIFINIIIIENLSSLKESFSMKQKLFDEYVLHHVLEKENSPYLETSPKPWDIMILEHLFVSLVRTKLKIMKKKV